MKTCMICFEKIEGNVAHYGGDLEKPIHAEVTTCLFNLRGEIMRLREENELAHKRLRRDAAYWVETGV